MIRHIVMWRLKDEALGADKAANAGKMKTMLEGLARQIPEIRRLEVGINTVEDEAAGDIVLVSEFNCEGCLATYQTHPAHQEVVAFVKQIAAERRVVDYEV